MRFGEIDLPDELITAHGEGELVIFAGAGVSAPPPSSLPDFRVLVREIEETSGATRGRHEAFDAFLGRLAREHFPVHEQVERRIARSDSKPNRLHRAIAGLFRTAESVRIVTTNFDKHLSTAVGARWPGVPEYIAPALPPGEDIRGIVYLHGAIGGHGKNLVLTDEDFGIAYLTKGFARRFLLELFQANHVLFVGFSHRDTVLNYLARGLPPGTLRYALSSEGDVPRWQSLGIQPIEWPKGARRETVIASCFEAWGRELSMSLADHEQQVREAVARGPNGLDPTSRDYLVARIGHPDTAALFCRAARDPEWLSWLGNVPEFEALFAPDTADGEVAWELAGWFAERFSVAHHPQALVAVARRGGRMSPVLWYSVARHLCANRPDPEVLHGWLPFLLSNVPDTPHDLLEYLLKDTRSGDDDDLALSLFDYLTEPRATARVFPALFTETAQDQALIEPKARGDAYWLGECLEKVFGPRPNVFARDLLAIATKHLEHAYRMQGPVADRDPLSLRRSAIEPHEQDTGSQKDWVDVLVDAARTSIEWAIGHDRRLAESYLHLWERSRALLVRRLAVYCVRRADWLSADQKLDWLLAHGWLSATPLRHEVYQLLAEAFPAATPDARTRLLAAVEAGPQGNQQEQPEHAERERFELLHWLTTHAPDDEEVRRALDAICGRHPQWQPSEHPDPLMWMEEAEWVGPPAVRVQDVLSLDPSDPVALSHRLGYRPVDEAADWFSDPRRPFLEAVAAACREDAGWGLRLAKALVERSWWDADLWRGVIEGWSEGSIEPVQWREILEVLRDHGGKAVHASSIARLLQEAVRARPPRLPVDLLELCDAVALDLWNALDGQAHEVTSPRDWLTEAINDPAGQLMIYFLHSLELRGPSARLPEDLRQVFQAAVEGPRRRDSLGASVLASQLHFLHARDRDWTCEVLIPGMHWDRDAARAQQMWHGFLTWGKLNPSLTEDLLPAYMSVFAHVDGLGELAGRFTEHLALVAFLTAKDPLEHGWLKVFVQRNSDERVAQWTHHVTFRLRDMPDPDRRAAWRRWIAQYWRQRNDGVPRTLQDQEARELVAWALETDEDFDQAVNLVCAGPRVGAPPSIFYERFRECGHAVRRPAAAARLLAHALAGERRPFWECDEASEVAMAAARTGQAHPNELRAILEQLLRLRCGGSDALRGAIEGSE